MSLHSFDTDEAIKHGVDKAIILSNIRFWLEKNKANQKHLHDDYCWTYNSSKAFAELFPYFSSSKIQRLLKELENDGIILTGNYNKSAYDRTKWFSMPEFCINKNQSIHSANLTNGLDGIGEPIPDSKPDDKPDSNNNSAFVYFWENMEMKRVARPKAEIAFNKQAKKEPDVLAFAELLVRDTHDRKKLNQFGFDKLNPTTYLNQRRWEDDKPVDLNIEYKYALDSFNNEMKNTNVPLAERITEKRADLIKALYAKTNLTPDTICNYFHFVATSSKFNWERGEAGSDPLDMTYFLTESAYNKARES